MPGYTYVAVDQNGREKRGRIEAQSSEEVSQQLKKDGLFPVEIKEQGVLNKDLDISIGAKVKPRDLSVFCRQFVSITQAGVPMKEALQMMTEQTENKWLKKGIAEVLTNVEMVQAGESSGSLDTSFERMAIHFEKEAKLKATIRKATIYPIILICAVIGVIAVMLLYVIPIFIDMFADLDVEMPALTMGVMNVSKWTVGHWYMILLVIAAVIAAYRLIYRTELGRLKIDYIKMKMPLFGKLTVKTACARFARTMSTLMASGISTPECLDTCTKVISNVHYKNALQKAKADVMRGIPLSEPLQASEVFPPMVYHMTGIGEETGNMEEMLAKLADYYDEEVEITTQSVLAALEPLIIVLMALIVGTLVIAVIMPIATMYNGLDNL